MIGKARAHPCGGVRDAHRPPIEKQLALSGWSFGDQVDHAAERRRSIQRGRGTFDDLHLREIERRHLEEAERVSLRAVQREAVGQPGGAHLDLVTVLELLAVDLLLVDLDAVARLEVLDV